VDNLDLQYHFLAFFDQKMIGLVKAFHLLESPQINLCYEHNHDKVIVIERAGLFFVFNFHPVCSFSDYQIPFAPGKYLMIFHSDLLEFGGYDRLQPGQIHFTQMQSESNGTSHFISLYLPSRTALVLKLVDTRQQTGQKNTL
jgi:1,4-alpha-glucan branching enzyme